MMKATPTFVGIDVSKARLDIALRPSGAMESFPDDETGIDNLLEQLCTVKPVLIVLEATGGIERSLVRGFWRGRTASAKRDQTIRQSPIWREQEDLLKSVPGIGTVISHTVLAELPELG